MSKKKKKKRGNPKKGGAYERATCKELSLWYSRAFFDEPRDDIFWRTSASGARATVRMKKDIKTANSCGDVMALHRVGRKLTRTCMIELKRGYSDHTNNGISILNMLDAPLSKKLKKGPILLRWVDKAIKEAKQHGRKHPIIIFRRDRKVSCIVIMHHTYEMLRSNYRNFTMADGQSCWVSLFNLHFHIFRLEDFLHWCPPNAFFRKVNILSRRRKIWNRGRYGGERIVNFRGLYQENEEGYKYVKRPGKPDYTKHKFGYPRPGEKELPNKNETRLPRRRSKS